MSRTPKKSNEKAFRLNYEPLAIVGMGCRFPGGANTPESFWNLLCEGVDAVSEIPQNRWTVDRFFDPTPSAPGKMYTRHGGFIDDVKNFDCSFFGISPREAVWMDPQQRILLKIAWEAFEDAGIVIDRNHKKSVGVFVGASSWDYARAISNGMEMAGVESYTGTGIAFSILANRISHRLNFNGPSMVVDTACSSSMVAISLACRSIWLGECDMALAGGCNLMLHPEMFVVFSRLSLLSPEGRSKAFSDAAKGFVRAEGAGLILLKPLSTAIQDNNPIYAVIRGIGVNQDGYTPEALTFPSGEAQGALIRQVYDRFGIDPRDITYVEAHGTGTSIGDPIEAAAIGSVLGPHHSSVQPCFMGSVKTNIGHLEPGAGIAGIIKAALMIRHRKIVPNLHFDNPNPDIDFDGLHLKIPLELTDWPAGRPVFVSINSFGFGGTNAHAVLSDAPDRTVEPSETGNRDAELFCLSANSMPSLYAYAEKCLEYLNGCQWRNFQFHDICRYAAANRYHHKHRLSIACTSRDHLIGLLEKFCRQETEAGMTSSEVLPDEQKGIVFVFSGQGAHWHGMGRKLFSSEPVFRDAIMLCHELFSTHAPWSLIDELFGADEHNSRLDDTAIAQPSLFAIQVALTALWESWGVRPAAVVGHSLGDITAAYVSGILSLEDAVRIVYYRSLYMSGVGPGKMLAVGIDADEVALYLDGFGNRVDIAALNTPISVTLSGDSDAIDELEKVFCDANVFCRPIQVRHPFHTCRMESVREGFLTAIEPTSYQKPKLPFYSTVKGRKAEPDDFSNTYWWENIRHAVLFSSAIGQLLDDQHKIFLEIGPHPVLSGPVMQCALHRDYKAFVVPSLQRNQNERVSLFSALGTLHALGVKWDLKEIFRNQKQPVPFPAYAWDDEPFWQQTESMRHFLLPDSHPLLGLRLPAPEPVWENPVHEWRLPYLKDHRVHGHCLFPGVAYIEMALASVHENDGLQYPVLEHLKLARAVFLSDSKSHLMHSSYNPKLFSLEVYAREETDGSEWTLNASCTVMPDPGTRHKPLPLNKIRSRCRDVIDGKTCYAELKQLGFEYGLSFQGIVSVYRGSGETLAEILIPEHLLGDLGTYHCHPAVLDACLQAVLATHTLDGDHSYLPVGIDRFHMVRPLQNRMWSYVFGIARQEGHHISSILVVDDQGEMIAGIEGVHLEGIPTGRTMDTLFENIMYNYKWMPVQGDPGKPPGKLHLTLPIADIASRVQHYASSLEYPATPDNIDRLCRLYIVDAFIRMGMNFQAGEVFSPEYVFELLGISENRQPLFRFLLNLLLEDGFLNCKNNTWTVHDSPPTGDIPSLWRDLIIKYPAFYAELTLIAKQAEILPDILHNTVNPDDLPANSNYSGLFEFLYRDAPFFRNGNLAIRFALENIIAALPRRQKLKILEIGGGTGGTAAYVLPVLDKEAHDYFFTDYREDLLHITANKLQSGAKHIHFQPLDIGFDPEHQDMEKHGFDVIIAVHSLCSADDPRQVLDHIKQLLAPSGVLMLLEPLSRAGWPALVFGRQWKDLALPDLLSEMKFLEVSSVHVESSSETYASRLIIGRGPIIHTNFREIHQPTETSGAWVIFCDSGGNGAELAGLLRACGNRCMLISRGERFHQTSPDSYTVNPVSAGDMHTLIGDVMMHSANESVSGIVHMWSLDIDGMPNAPANTIDDIYAVSCNNILLLIQALQNGDEKSIPPLWLITRCAQPLGNANETVSPFQAPVWGLGRVISTEFPDMRCTRVDLCCETPEDTSRELRSLFEELHANHDDDEIAFRGPVRYINRLHRVSIDEIPFGLQADGPEFGFRLESPGDGVINHLALRNDIIPEPGPEEVLIKVHAAGLNFSDVMKSLNLYPGLPEGPVPLGLECAGIIVETGMEVDGFQPGDRVIAVGQFCISSHVTTHEALVMRIPDKISYAEAATIPVAFLTAQYALLNIGRLQQGERVLIHSATGGVGQAAIQIARNIGAEIFATAGTSEKRTLLRDMGINLVMDSRTLGFADDILRYTNGEGVDVILNSLSGPAITKGLSILRHHGRFVEIGKRDIYQDSRIGLLPFQKNLSFCAVDLDSVIRSATQTVKEIQEDCRLALKNGKYSPLPFRAFPVDMAADAFRYMAQAKHIGKIVLTMNDHRPKTLPPAIKDITFSGDAAYLVVGGFGGYGLLLAQWLFRQGARHIALLGRRGAVGAKAKAVLSDLRQNGAHILELKADVSREEDVIAGFKQLASEMPPLRGIFHAAMVLSDKLIKDLTQADMTDVMDSKIKGAWLLHRYTKTIPLDFFVMFSSMTSLTGTRGQGNYAAANAFLDALAHYRANKGLKGLAINWGRLGGTGRVAEDGQLSDWFDTVGVRSVSAEQAIRATAHLLQRSPVQTAVMDIDWGHLGKIVEIFRSSNRFRHLYHIDTESAVDGADGQKFASLLRDAEGSQKTIILQTALVEQIAKVLGTKADGLDLEKPLTQFGLDSLMVAELSNWIIKNLNISLPMIELIRGPSIQQLADILLRLFLLADMSGTPSETDTHKPSNIKDAEATNDPLLDAIDDLPDEQLDDLLEQMLSEETLDDR